MDLQKKININFRFDTFIHCAAATPLKYYNKKEYKMININGLKKILKFCNNEVKSIILLSTVSVYGKINSKIILSTGVYCANCKHRHNKRSIKNIIIT